MTARQDVFNLTEDEARALLGELEQGGAGKDKPMEYIERDAYDDLVMKLKARRALIHKLRHRMKKAGLAEKLAVQREIKALSKLIDSAVRA
jgi:hypothetical protein